MLERIIALLEREMANVEHNILKGTCPDYTTYREQIAMLGTLMLAIDITKRAFAEDDDDE